jgi:hypothetical protein
MGICRLAGETNTLAEFVDANIGDGNTVSVAVYRPHMASDMSR